MAPLDASPCPASWGPLPPSPCTDTAQTRGVSEAVWCEHVAHQGSCTAWAAPLGGPAQEALAMEGRRVKEQLLPGPWDHLLQQSPGPHWEGQGQGQAVDRGSVVPPLPWGH